MFTKKNRIKGFTSVELLLVLGVVSLIAGGIYVYKTDNESLSVGAPTKTFHKDLVPIDDSTYDLGTNDNRWSTIYVDSCIGGGCGGGGGGAGVWSTTTDNAAIYNNTGDAVVIGDSATSSNWVDEKLNVVGNSLVTGTTTIEQALQIGLTSGNNALKITAADDYASSDSTGGMVRLTNTLNNATALGIYTNHAGSAANDLLVIQSDNTAFDRAGLRVKQDGVGRAALFECNTTSGSNQCVDITSTDADQTVLGVTGQVDGHGVVKVTANGGNSSSAGISIDIQDDDAQGIFLDTQSGYTGKILNLRENGTEYLVLDGSGILTISQGLVSQASSTVNGTLTLTGNLISTGAVDTTDILDNTITFADPAHTLTIGGNPTLAAGQAYWASTGVIFEGGTADTNELLLTNASLSSDITITLPAITGTLASLSGTQTFGGTKTFSALTTHNSGFVSQASSTVVGALTVTNSDINFTGLDCSGNANGGALTVDASGNVTCSDDDSGGGGGGTNFFSTSTDDELIYNNTGKALLFTNDQRTSTSTDSIIELEVDEATTTVGFLSTSINPAYMQGLTFYEGATQVSGLYYDGSGTGDANYFGWYDHLTADGFVFTINKAGLVEVDGGAIINASSTFTTGTTTVDGNGFAIGGQDDTGTSQYNFFQDGSDILRVQRTGGSDDSFSLLSVLANPTCEPSCEATINLKPSTNQFMDIYYQYYDGGTVQGGLRAQQRGGADYLPISLDFYDGSSVTPGIYIATTSAGLGTTLGDVGIGTTQPTDKLTIVDTNPTVVVDASGNATLRTDRGGTSNFATLAFATAGTDQFSLQMRNDSTNDLHFRDNTSGTTFLKFSDSLQLPLLGQGFISQASSTIDGALTVTGTDINFTGYDCSGNANGGVLTVDASGNVTCDDDDGGSGSSEWTDNGTFLSPNETEGIIVSASSTFIGDLTITGSSASSTFEIGPSSNNAYVLITGDDDNALVIASSTASGYNDTFDLFSISKDGLVTCTECIGAGDVEPELKTHIFSVVVASSTMGTTTQVAQHKLPTAATIQRVSCSTDVGTVDIQLDERTETTPNSAGTDVLSAELVCDTNMEATASFANAGIAADALVNLDIDGVESSPTNVRIHIDYTVDD